MTLHQLVTKQDTPAKLQLTPQTTLLYAEFDGQGNISMDNFIVLCRDDNGRVCGLHISDSIRELYAFEAHVTDEEMAFILGEYERKIAGFCQVFAAEFEQIFALPPDVYFAAARHYWHYKQAS